MANTAANIKKSWTLLEFAKTHGKKMQVGEFSNSDTGEVFKSCVFGEGDSITFVSFSPNLGELTPKEIASMKDDLQVVEWDNQDTDKHGYTLCKKGRGAWEEVDLGF